MEELQSIQHKNTDICVSYDIKSLYTNVPLKEVIEDITDTVYSSNAKSSFFRESTITKRVFKQMLTKCSESIFLYKDHVYRQRDGVAMGSPLAPLLANWFVARIENNILQQDLPYKPILYRRYVDDIFALFRTTAERDLFYNHLNHAHPNLAFTMENTTTSLPFLDTSISITNWKFTTEVYRKPTNTGVVMDYRCMAPFR